MDVAPVEVTVRRLDLGCGKNPRPGFEGVDILPFGQQWHCDLTAERWVLSPWAVRSDDGAQYVVPEGAELAADSIDEIFSSHFVEHLTNPARMRFWNELCRVLKKGGTATIITPNWSHACAYGDPTHQWPPLSEWTVLYLNKQWRDQNAPRVPLPCDFDWVCGGGWDEQYNASSQDVKTFAMRSYTNAMRDLQLNLTKR